MSGIWGQIFPLRNVFDFEVKKKRTGVVYDQIIWWCRNVWSVRPIIGYYTLLSHRADFSNTTQMTWVFFLLHWAPINFFGSNFLNTKGHVQNLDILGPSTKLHTGIPCRYFKFDFRPLQKQVTNFWLSQCI